MVSRGRFPASCDGIPRRSVRCPAISLVQAVSERPAFPGGVPAARRSALREARAITLGMPSLGACQATPEMPARRRTPWRGTCGTSSTASARLTAGSFSTRCSAASPRRLRSQTRRCDRCAPEVRRGPPRRHRRGRASELGAGLALEAELQRLPGLPARSRQPAVDDADRKRVRGTVGRCARGGRPRGRPRRPRPPRGKPGQEVQRRGGEGRAPGLDRRGRRRRSGRSARPGGVRRLGYAERGRVRLRRPAAPDRPDRHESPRWLGGRADRARPARSPSRDRRRKAAARNDPARRMGVPRRSEPRARVAAATDRRRRLRGRRCLAPLGDGAAVGRGAGRPRDEQVGSAARSAASQARERRAPRAGPQRPGHQVEGRRPLVADGEGPGRHRRSLLRRPQLADYPGLRRCRADRGARRGGAEARASAHSQRVRGTPPECAEAGK